MTDLWVIANFFLAAIFLAVVPSLAPWQRGMFVVYGALRVAEIIIHQCKVVLLEAHKPNEDTARDHVRTMILSLHGYFEVILWWGGVYRIAKDWFTQPTILQSWDGALYHSVMTVSTLGFGDIAPVYTQSGGRMLTVLHIITSLFLNLVVLTRLISNLPTQKHNSDRI